MDGKSRLTPRGLMPIGSMLVLGCLWLSGSVERALSQAAPADNAVGATVDKVFADWDKPDSPGCAVAVMRAGKIVYERGYGMADLDHSIAITPTTIFHAASLAKQFTAMAILLLEEQGKLKLNDDVRKYVPELSARLAPSITIGDMLRHLSGIRDQWALITMAGWHLYDDVVTESDVMDLVARMESLDYMPGERLNYSNTGYSLAGLIVERVSGKPLSDFARDNIFAPLGMKNTIIARTHGQIVQNRAYGYWTTNGNRPFTLGMPNLDITGPTNLLTTVEDLALWDRNFDDKTVGGDFALSQMRTPATLTNGARAELEDGVGYGLGVKITKYRNLPVVEHDGRDAGYRAHLMRLPDQHFAVACLCNLALPDDRLPGELAREIVDVLLADQLGPKPPRPNHAHAPASTNASPGADLSEFTGRYRSDEVDSTYTVELRGSGLVLTRPRYKPTPLTQTFGPIFSMEGFSRPIPSGNVVFQVDNRDRVTGFVIDGGRINALLFHKQ
jgi:CubicO group peptidase (beta-lactamase class C family)